MRERLNDILKKHTGQDLATIEADTERDRFMEADEAMKYGLIDKVITDRIKPEERLNKTIKAGRLFGLPLVSCSC